jgi:methyl-accepting chemotaxis protein
MNDTARYANQEEYLNSLEQVIRRVLPVLSLQIETSRKECSQGVADLLERFLTLSRQVDHLVSSGVSANRSSTEFEDIKQTGSEILENVDGVIVVLQFQDRVDQILSHVVNSMEQMVNVISAHEKGGADNLKNMIDVECLLENIKATYSTTEERLNHKGKDSHELPLNEPSELIFF